MYKVTRNKLIEVVERLLDANKTGTVDHLVLSETHGLLMAADPDNWDDVEELMDDVGRRVCHDVMHKVDGLQVHLENVLNTED